MPITACLLILPKEGHLRRLVFPLSRSQGPKMFGRMAIETPGRHFGASRLRAPTPVVDAQSNSRGCLVDTVSLRGTRMPQYEELARGS